MADDLVLLELIRLGGHRVLASEAVAAELELLGHARRIERQPVNPLGWRQQMQFAKRVPMGADKARILGEIG